MIYVIEFWNAKPAWLALSEEERSNYMNQVGGAIEDLVAKGVQVLTWSNNNVDISKRSPHDYFAIWTFPDQEMTNHFLGLVESVGWYDYFEQNMLPVIKEKRQELNGKISAEDQSTLVQIRTTFQAQKEDRNKENPKHHAA